MSTDGGYTTEFTVQGPTDDTAKPTVSFISCYFLLLHEYGMYWFWILDCGLVTARNLANTQYSQPDKRRQDKTLETAWEDLTDFIWLDRWSQFHFLFFV